MRPRAASPARARPRRPSRTSRCTSRSRSARSSTTASSPASNTCSGSARSWRSSASSWPCSSSGAACTAGRAPSWRRRRRRSAAELLLQPVPPPADPLHELDPVVERKVWEPRRVLLALVREVDREGAEVSQDLPELGSHPADVLEELIGGEQVAEEELQQPLVPILEGGYPVRGEPVVQRT